MAKIILVHLEYKIILELLNCAFFQYCDSHIGLFSIPCDVLAINLLCFILVNGSLLLEKKS